MKNALKYIYALMALIVVSCTEKEMTDGVGGEDVTGVEVGALVDVPCDISVIPFGSVQSKAVSDPEDYTANELSIDNFWLIQFGQTAGDDGARPFLAAIYHTPVADGEGNKWGGSWVQMSENHLEATGMVWIVTNIGQTDVNGKEYFSSYSGKTLADFYADGIPLSEVQQLTTLNGGNKHLQNNDGLAIPMSGSSYFDADDLKAVDDKKGLVVKLKSIVAKLTVNASWVENLSAIRLMRIPSSVSFAPDKVSRTAFRSLLYDYDIPVPSSKSFTLYIPQNKPAPRTASQTQASSGTASTKTENAPVKATYISMDVTSSGQTLSVNVFPGEDEKDYNILANTHYTENIGSASAVYTSYLADNKDDSRLIEKRIHTEKSNCYMIHPIFQGNETTLRSSINREEVYVLPFVARVNEAASSEKSGRSIGENDEWIIHQVWQDEPMRLVYLAESSGLRAWKNGTDGAETYAEEYFGRGLKDVYVAARRSASYDYTRGNVLLALRKKDPSGSYVASNGQKYGNIIWSWHLWVTDYEPDGAPAYTSGYHRDVKGSDGSKVFHFDFWSNVYKWIMDRNLGARSWEPSERYDTRYSLDFQTYIRPWGEAYGLFYQWGRKDPFPGNGVLRDEYITELKLYDLEGKERTDRIKSTAGPVALSATHATPMELKTSITYGIGNDYWAWNDINQKSLYDPCPPGWLVPSYKVYEKFVTNLAVTEQSNVNTAYARKTLDGIFGYGVNNLEGYAIDPSGNKGATAAIYFPVSGFVTYGARRDMGGLTDLWALESKTNENATTNPNRAAYLYIGRPLTGGGTDALSRGVPIVNVYGPAERYSKFYAFGMRCVKTYDYPNI
ncbi:MAG: DUF4906 domain-containing protein [Bacteroidales bacterium]|nr:DUF4906 domain-containing protein [Bacteroidales bacterium]